MKKTNASEQASVHFPADYVAIHKELVKRIKSFRSGFSVSCVICSMVCKCLLENDLLTWGEVISLFPLFSNEKSSWKRTRGKDGRFQKTKKRKS